MTKICADNLIIVNFYLESGCVQDEGEVMMHWQPLFAIYDKLFVDMIYEAMEEWLSDNKLDEEQWAQVVFRHVREHDGGGACLGEWFEPLIEAPNDR